MYKTNITGAHRVGNRSDHLVCASFKDPIFGLAKFGYLPTVKSQVTPKRLFSISHCIAVESCAHLRSSKSENRKDSSSKK